MLKFNVKEFGKVTAVYLLSFFLNLIVMVYLLNIPQLITNEPSLVKEYYYQKASKSIPEDLVIVVLYLLLAQLLVYLFKIRGFIRRLLVVCVTTALLSTGFYIYFTSKPIKQSSFFSRWFHTVKMKAVLYDVIYLGMVYSLMILFLTIVFPMIKDYAKEMNN
tara:strand:+ start:7246 stop:7731 length:486 start_codon:yes stop_codon:yes gene_type:complete